MQLFGVGHAGIHRHRYPECPTPNIGTIRSPASYKILLRLEQLYVFASLPIRNTLQADIALCASLVCFYFAFILGLTY